MEQYVLNKENIDEDGDTIYNKRNYIINEEKNNYTFRIDSCQKNLYFSISMKDNLEYNYKIKMNLSTIVDKLELNPQAYNKIELILKIFDNIYENKKIAINLIDDRACTLVIKFINVLEEKTYEINLEKNYLSEKEKYTDIINRFKLLNKYNNVYDEKILQMNNKIAELTDKIAQKNKEIKDEINKKDNIINEMNQKIKEQENKYDYLQKLFIELIQKNSVELEASFNSKIENLAKTMNEKSANIENFINSKINKNNINNQNELTRLKAKINLLEPKIDNHEYLLNKIKNINDKYKNFKSEINDKFKEQKDINEKINKKIHYENKEYTKKINYKFQKDPNKLHYKKDIANPNVPNGWNDIFEIFISYKNCKEYFVSPNVNTFNLDIYDLTLNNNNLFLSLKGHNSCITTVRYFLNNKNDEEYLISTDNNNNVIIWDINNNYNIKYNFNTFYGTSKLSCLLIFLKNSYDNYIVTSAENKSDNNDELATKVYSFNNGKLIKYIKDTKNQKIYYLLSWFNKENKNNYIIQFAENKIIISNLLENEKDNELVNKEEAPHYNGFIKCTENIDYLYSSSKNGYIHIWNLYNSELLDIINVNPNQQPLSNIIYWNHNYTIAADYNNCSFKIVSKDQTNYNINITEIKINHIHRGQLAYIKKINHPIYGESLLSAATDNTIKLWTTD